MDPLSTFANSCQRISDARNAADGYLSAQKIASDDLDLIYEALFLRLMTAFESFLEETFFEAIEGKLQYSDSRGAKIVFHKDAVARDLLLGDDDYLKWLPLSNAIKIGARYLFDDRPFGKFDDSDRSQIGNMVVIRNAIAHRSKAANDKFMSQVIGSRSMLQAEKTPAGFLRSKVSGSPTRRATNQFDACVGSLATIAKSVYTGKPK
jgi:hypothetical protein